MEFLEPSNFFDLAELIVNILIGLVAVSGLYIAFLTYQVAQKALGEWKQEKAHDIDLEAIASMHDAIVYLRELTRVYTDSSKLDDFEISEAKKIREIDFTFYDIYVKHKAHWNVHEKNKIAKNLKDVALRVANTSNNIKIKSFYSDYVFLSNTIRSIVGNYYAIKINELNVKFQVLDYKEPTDLNLSLINIIPAEIKKQHGMLSDIEILYLYFTGEGIMTWIRHLEEIEISFYKLPTTINHPR